MLAAIDLLKTPNFNLTEVIFVNCLRRRLSYLPVVLRLPQYRCGRRPVLHHNRAGNHRAVFRDSKLHSPFFRTAGGVILREVQDAGQGPRRDWLPAAVDCDFDRSGHAHLRYRDNFIHPCIFCFVHSMAPPESPHVSRPDEPYDFRRQKYLPGCRAEADTVS